jgi:hypothetical protein
MTSSASDGQSTVWRAPLRGAILASALLLAVRLYAAFRVGFGDAEALYASYAIHPQPVYLDHPGLIGVVARILGGGSAPSPLAAHLATALIATAAPWIAMLTARAAGASIHAAALAALALVLAPEISIGLFALTPDLLLIVLWYASVGASLWALSALPGSLRALVGALASGAAAGLACDSKVSGLLLLTGLVIGWASREARAHRRTLAPWVGLAVAFVLLAPVWLDETARGFPMLRHRLVETQSGAGLSLRNLGALAGGQLIYVTPPLLLAAFALARDLHRRRREDATSRLLWSLTVASLPLVLLCCVSRVAEPHWIAPIYLALPVHLARRSTAAPLLLRASVARAAVATSAAVLLFAHAWVLFPVGPSLLGSSYVARYDLANDLYAWEPALPVLRRALAESANSDLPPPIVVGPHWTVCAQIHAALPPSVLVGCQAEIPDDFERWVPSATWKQAPVLLFVTDDRFDTTAGELRDRRVDGTWHASLRRGGAIVRRITLTRLVSAAVALDVPKHP